MVALARGGALETVIDGETGVLFDELTVASLSAALDRVASTARREVDACAHTPTVLTRTPRRSDAAVDETIAAPSGTTW